MISIRRYTAQEFDTVKEFYFRAFKGDIDRKIAAFKWIQTQNPFIEHDNNYVLLFLNGTLVGYWGIMPMKFYYFGKPIQVLFSQETLVDSSCRRQGLATKLLSEVNRSDHLLVSLWHNEKILAIKQREGWSNIGNFRPLRKIFRLQNLIKLKLRNPFLQRTITCFLSLYLGIKSSRNKIADDYNIQSIKRCGGEFDDFFIRVAPELGILSDRSSATLNWKYIDIPHKKYVFLATRKEGQLCGYAVLGIEKQENNIRKGIIVDLLAKPDEPEAVACLVKRCDEIFLNRGVDFSVCQVSLPVFRRVLKKQGYNETRIRSTDSLWIYNAEKNPAKNSVKDIGNWYFTYGESDGDMW